MACDKLILTDFLLKNKLFFEPNLLSEDELWSFQCAIKLRRIAFLHSNATYLYYFREGSIIKSKDKKHFDSFQKIAEKMEASFKNEINLNKKKLILKHLISFKEMCLVMNWQAVFNENLWKESYKNFAKLQSLKFWDYFSDQFSLKTKKEAFYTSLPVDLGYKLFRYRYGK